MKLDANIFVFISPDGLRFALTRFEDGTNLPPDYLGAWIIAHDMIPLTLGGARQIRSGHRGGHG